MKIARKTWSMAGAAGAVLALGLGTGLAQMEGNTAGQGTQGAQGMHSQQSMNGMKGMSGMQCSPQDQKFMKQAAQDSNYEIKMGRLAMQKGSSQDVKDFGKMIMVDHMDFKKQLQSADQQMGMKPAMGLSSEEQGEYSKLQGLSGDSFDKQYIETMLKDHHESLQDSEQEDTNGQSQEVKQLAQKSRDTDERHFNRIKEIAQAHHIDSSPNGGNSGGI